MKHVDISVRTSIELFCWCRQGARSVLVLPAYDWTEIARFYSSWRGTRIRALLQDLIQKSDSQQSVDDMACRRSAEPPSNLFPGRLQRFSMRLLTSSQHSHTFPMPSLQYIMAQLSRLVVGLGADSAPDFVREKEEGWIFRRELNYAETLCEVFSPGFKRPFQMARSIEFFDCHPDLHCKTLDEILACIE